MVSTELSHDASTSQVGQSAEVHDRLARFEAHLRDHERLAPDTVYAWTRGVRLLLDFVADPKAASMGEVGVAELSAWLRDAEEAGLASGTRQNRWYAVRAYYRFLEHEGRVGETPLKGVRPPRARHEQRREYSAQEAEEILALARRRAHGGGPLDALDYVLLSTLRYTGARSGEVIKVRTADLDLERRSLKVFGKGAKWRTVPLPRPLVVVLLDYVQRVRPQLSASSWLFPSRDRRPSMRGLPISSTQLYWIVRGLGEASGIGGPHHPHRWRHTYATHLLRAGVDLVIVRDLLGHADVTTTAVYLHLLRDDLRDGVDSAFR